MKARAYRCECTLHPKRHFWGQQMFTDREIAALRQAMRQMVVSPFCFMSACNGRLRFELNEERVAAA